MKITTEKRDKNWYVTSVCPNTGATSRYIPTMTRVKKYRDLLNRGFTPDEALDELYTIYNHN